MNDFLGFLPVGVGTKFPIGLVSLSTGAPISPDSNPKARIYGQEGFVDTGDVTLTPFESGTITGATNASPIVVTFGTANTLTTGTALLIAAVGGNTNANGLHIITVLSTTTAQLDVNGNAPYTSGGTWQTAGLYLLDLTVAAVPSLVAALEAGQNYAVDITWAVSSSPKKATFQFTVG
jgi:hypothetical protein